jgi:hypothetical protein
LIWTSPCASGDGSLISAIFISHPCFPSPRWIQEVVLPSLDHVEKRRRSGADSGERQVCWVLLLLKAIVFFVILFCLEWIDVIAGGTEMMSISYVLFKTDREV